ncbi:MAG: metallophosphoesterase [bacterium]|nr:metallophosphoesterase [bacterium]
METERNGDHLTRSDAQTPRGAGWLLRRIVAGLVFLTLFVGVMGSAHYYLLLRLALDPAWPRIVASLLIATMVIGLVAVVAQGIPRRHRSAATRALAWGAYTWLGLLFYLFVSTAAADLFDAALGLGSADVASLTQSLPFARGKALAIVTLSCLAAVLALRGGRAMPAIHRLEIELENLPAALDGFRIVQLCDIHIGPLLDREFARYLASTVNTLEPDLVAVTGDLVDGSVSRLADDVEPLRALRAGRGVFFVTGNHDFYSGVDSWASQVGDFGWQPLRNRSVAIEHAGATFVLAGVDDPHGAMVDGVGGEDLDLALRGIDEETVVVLLAHDPASFRRARKRNVALQLSGHTHGGQIWPFNWAVRASVPWVAGHYRDGRAQLYVSCGTGFWGPPMRLGTRSEITELTLRTRNSALPSSGRNQPGSSPSPDARSRPTR